MKNVITVILDGRGSLHTAKIDLIFNRRSRKGKVQWMMDLVKIHWGILILDESFERIKQPITKRKGSRQAESNLMHADIQVAESCSWCCYCCA